ncbi:MAG: hypothetical protein AAGA56_05055 [Myxococcota bacterium]
MSETPPDAFGEAPRPVQYFSDAYLVHCRSMTPDQICNFLEGFRQLHGAQKRVRATLVSVEVPEPLLLDFRERALAEGIPYQEQIQRLMAEWVGRQEA